MLKKLVCYFKSIMKNLKILWYLESINLIFQRDEAILFLEVKIYNNLLIVTLTYNKKFRSYLQNTEGDEISQSFLRLCQGKKI